NPAGTAILQSSALKLDNGDNLLNGFAQTADGSLIIGRAAKLRSLPISYFVEKVNAQFGSVFSKPIAAKINDVAVGADGSIYLTGSVQASDLQGVQAAPFPILNSFRPTTADTDLFVMKLPPDGGPPVYSTLLSATCTFECPSPDGSFDVGYVVV